MSPSDSHPILSSEEAGALEKRLLQGEETVEWEAMRRAGVGMAEAVLADFPEAGGFPADGRILVLAGKGHNAGDAFIAAGEILHRHPRATAQVVFAFGERTLRPLTARAWRDLADLGTDRVEIVRPEGSPRYELCLDGVFGFQFRPPLPPAAAGPIGWANGLEVRLRAAVDLPSGLDEDGAFRADFTYATGIVKRPLLGCGHAGRVRYVDLGFFEDSEEDSPDRILRREILRPLAGLRRPDTDKRTYGHLLVVGGSLSYPGAILMTVLSALRSGVGLLTAFVPESLVPAYAARAPEAMWVGMPEAPGGGLALEGEHLVKERLPRATAVAMGPGMGREDETQALLASITHTIDLPTVIDADALQTRIIDDARAPLILTPHAGELKRISGDQDLRTYAARTGAVVVKKGPITSIAMSPEGVRHGIRQPDSVPDPLYPIYHSFFGGPVLARGGSGDILSGLIGGLLAQTPQDRLLAASRGVVWHGSAADLLARSHGPTAVTTTQLLDFLPAVLR